MCAIIIFLLPAVTSMLNIYCSTKKAVS